MPNSEVKVKSPKPGVLGMLRLCWPRLLAADVLAKALGFLVVAPVTALLLGFFSRRSGSTVLTDEDILFFFLSPTGIAALLIIGVFTFWIVFTEQAVMLTLGLGTLEHGTVTLGKACRFVAARSMSLLRLALALLIRLLLLAAPFALLASIIYWALLTRFDINYYLEVRPVGFWVAAGLMGLNIAGLATLLGFKVFHWIFALPLLLFERKGAKTAISESHTFMQGRRVKVAIWLFTWALMALAASVLVTGAIGGIGRFVIPAASASLARVALSVGFVVVLTMAANLMVSFIIAALLSLIIVHLYIAFGGSGQVMVADSRSHPPVEPRRRSRVRVLAWGSAFALVAIVVAAVIAVRSTRIVDTAAITAHRGSSAAAPENTLAAIEMAISDGADWVEIDVQETADGAVIVFHDGDLKRLARLPLRTVDATYDELREVDVGSWFSPEFADQRIPILEQVLELCKGRIPVNIELKYYGSGGELERKVIEAVERYGMESQVVLMSLKRDGIVKAKAMRPDWKMGLLTAVALGDLTKIDVDFLAVNASLASRSLIWSAHSRGKEVHVWTVNDPVQMSTLVSRGVDNLITDVPALGRRLLEERSGLSVVERLLLEFGAWSELIPPNEEGEGAIAAGGR